MLVTLRDTPADAEITSHQMLLRGGFIRRVTAGVYAYMPLMWRVIQKISSIIEEEMDSIGCLQTLLPQLHPSELWKQSGRWQGYTAGEGIMFHLKDRQGREIGLGPTHEEVVTKIASESIHSYKQLPVSLYQIQTKFRDEIRPRFGLMRSREFIMKDAYSFHSNEKCLQGKYNEMNDAYKRIFSRCGLKTVAVDADSGAIGGASSQEFMVTADSGEDLILTSPDGKYAANQEKAISKASEPLPLPEGKSCFLDTPSQGSIKELCSANGLDASQIVKVLAMLAIKEDGQQQPLLISLRGDQELNEVKLTNFLSGLLEKPLIDLQPITQEKLNAQGLGEWPFGSIGPDLSNELLKKAKTWENQFIRLADKTAIELKTFVCGANEIDKHRAFITWADLGVHPKTSDFRKAKPGDRCSHDPRQKLKESRGIEVGHIFQLGKKYSKALDASFTNEEGINENFWMGCYGIGVSRLAQAAIEQNHDSSGMSWPISIAPFEVIIVPANIQDPLQKSLSELIYQKLKDQGVDALLDDRKERAGVKFKDADLIGIPWRLVIGRDASSDKVELTKRDCKKTELLKTDEAVKKLLEEIFTNRS